MRLTRFVAAALLPLLAGTAAAQAPGKWPPDSLINTQIIPRNTPPIQVVGQMRNIAIGLGVRCVFCHVGSDTMSLAQVDFASDAKRNKLVARQMMRMVLEINHRIDTIPERGTPGISVTCATCHRGVSRPEPLAQVVTEAAVAFGADSAISIYRALRQRYFGRDAYDFSENSLNAAAFRTGRAGKTRDALALLALNETQFPTSAAIAISRANVLLMQGDTASAAASLREALRRDSTNDEARGRLRDIGAPVVAPITDNGAHPSVAPDGAHIAFTSNRDGTPDLYVMDVDGGHVVRVTSDAADETIADWLGPRTIAYSVAVDDSAMLYRADLDGHAPVRIGAVLGRAPRTSRDGSVMAFGRGPWQSTQLFVAGRNGTSPRQITPGRDTYWCHAVSPDGRSVAANRRDSAGMQVWIFDARTSAARQVTGFDSTSGQPQCPAWSADGKRLAVQADIFDRANRAQSTSHIWVVDPATRRATKLGAHAAPWLDETPSWFPDGSRIAFMSNRTGRWEVWTMRADGSGQVQLTR